MSSNDLSSGSGFTYHVSEMKVVFLGSMNAGKSSAVNTILGREEFDLKRSAQCVMRQGEVAGRKITVVEAPGWQRNKAVRNSTELLKQEIVLSVSRCPPGPHAVLLVLRLNVKSWKSEQNALEGYLELLTERVWRHTIVLFTFGDALGDTTIEQYIKREEYLQGLVEKCGNRYHVFTNHTRRDDSQVTELLEKIEKMVEGNGGCHLEMDKKMIKDVEERRREEEKRSKERVMEVSKKKEYIRSHMSETDHLLEMRLVLLGYKNAGKSSSGSTILRDDKFRDRKNKCPDVLMGDGNVAGRRISVVEAPGWQRNTPVRKSTEQFKQQMVSHMSMCPPGPHAVLLVMCLDLKFRRKQRNVLEGYLSLLGDNVWSHTIVLFTFGDFLGDTTIEQYIEREGEDLQWLVERCANRYHVLNNTKKDDDAQVTQLLEKVEEMVAGNGGRHLEIDFQSKSELNMEDSAAGSNTPPVPRPAGMDPHVSQNKPGKVSDLEAQGILIKDFQRGPRVSQKQKRISTRIVPPESVEKCTKDKNIEEYRFLCLHAVRFRCKSTDIVFEMKGKGEVLYRIVSWDKHVLDRLGHNKPAGPLYSIDCGEGSIRYLHLPHCETEIRLAKLSVVHVSDGTVKIIQEQQVTQTHVIIDVQHLSCFGLVKSLLFKPRPIQAQVLLFYQHVKSKLYIHLVPKNIDVENVKKRQESSTYIKTTSQCRLIPGKIYRPCCKTSDRDYVSQPEDEIFDCDYDPNYHPTFELIFNTEVNSIKLSLLDENGGVAWKPRLLQLEGTETASTTINTTGIDFVDTYRAKLIQRVSSVMEIADRLKARAMMTDELYSNIQAATTPQGKMRELYNCLNSGDVKVEFYRILQEKESYLVEELQPGTPKEHPIW